MAKRRRFSAEFKAKVALEAIRGEHSLAELATRHGIAIAGRNSGAPDFTNLLGEFSSP